MPEGLLIVRQTFVFFLKEKQVVLEHAYGIIDLTGTFVYFQCRLIPLHCFSQFAFLSICHSQVILEGEQAQACTFCRIIFDLFVSALDFVEYFSQMGIGFVKVRPMGASLYVHCDGLMPFVRVFQAVGNIKIWNCVGRVNCNAGLVLLYGIVGQHKLSITNSNLIFNPYKIGKLFVKAVQGCKLLLLSGWTLYLLKKPIIEVGWVYFGQFFHHFCEFRMVISEIVPDEDDCDVRSCKVWVETDGSFVMGDGLINTVGVAQQIGIAHVDLVVLCPLQLGLIPLDSPLPHVPIGVRQGRIAQGQRIMRVFLHHLLSYCPLVHFILALRQHAIQHLHIAKPNSSIVRMQVRLDNLLVTFNGLLKLPLQEQIISCRFSLFEPSFTDVIGNEFL